MLAHPKSLPSQSNPAQLARNETSLNRLRKVADLTRRMISAQTTETRHNELSRVQAWFEKPIAIKKTQADGHKKGKRPKKGEADEDLGDNLGNFKNFN